MSHVTVSVKPRKSGWASNRVDALMRKNVDLFLRLKDPELRKEYVEYRESNRSEISALCYCFFLTVVFGMYILWQTGGALSFFDPTDLNIVLLVVTYVLSFLIFGLSMLVYNLYKIKFRRIPTDNHILAYLTKYLTALEIALMVCVTFVSCFRMIVRVLNGQCERQGLSFQWNCNPLAELGGLPQDTLLMLLIGPYLSGTLLQGVSIRWFSICWIASFVTLCWCVAYATADSDIPLIIVYVLTSFIVAYEGKRQHLYSFFIYLKYKQSLARNEEKADENLAQEMRHMIANVAHDLKTPLSSFLGGVEFIGQVISELNTKINERNVTQAMLQECVISIANCLKNIKNTNSFMLMTINRCIDYTKASKGFKLTPKPETIDLLEILQLPIMCMRDVQSRISISLRPIPQDICNFIITDKQWLQENILCLLSNAAKYSSGGEVTITLSLIEPQLDPTDAGMINKVRSMFSKNKVTPDAKYEVVNEGPPSIQPLPHQASNSTSLSPIREHRKSHNEGDAKDQDDTVRMTPSGSPSRVRSRSDDEVKPISTTDWFFAGKGRQERFDSDASVRSRTKSHDESEDGSPNPAKRLKPQPPSPAKADKVEKAERPNIAYLRIEVEDNGIGISEDKLEYLFAPFKQAQRLAGGTGLGLYSLMKRIEALNGYCGVQGRHDGEQGSLFWFEIPYRPDKLFAKMQNRRHSYMIQAGDLDSLSISPVPTEGDDTPPRGMSVRSDDSKQSKTYLVPTAGDPSIKVEFNGTEKCVTPRMSGEDKPVINPHMNLLGDHNSNPPTSASANLGIVTNNHGDNSAASGNASNTVSPSSQGITKLDVLIVEDSPSIVKMTTMMLKRHGHAVTVASDGVEALKRIQERIEETGKIFDVILMDLQMPVMDGLECTRRLRQLELTGSAGSSKKSHGNDSKSKGSSGDSRSQSPQPLKIHHIVIGVSANSDNETAQEAFSMGVDAFLGKPFSITTFYETYDQVKQQHHHHNHHQQATTQASS